MTVKIRYVTLIVSLYFVEKGGFMSNAFKKDIKGHGYFRKTNLGLVSGIALSTSLALSLGISNAYAAETLPTNSSEVVVNGATLNDEGEFVREENVSVKEAELKAKVDEVKAAGVTVKEKPAESVGVAKTETEEASLKKEAETKVDEQIKALEVARKEEEARKAKLKEVEELKEYFIENNKKKNYLITHLNSRDAEIDKGNSKTFSNFSSNKGDVYFLDVDTIDLTSELTLQNMGKNRVTNVAKKINATLNIKKGVDNTDAYIFKVRNGETISYNAKLSEESYLSKEFGIDSISIKRTYNFGFTNQARYYDVLTNNLTETNFIFTNISNSTNPNSGTPHVTTEYLYKDKLGNTISLKELYIKAINDGIFYNNELLNSENISDESLKQPESDEKSFGSNTKLYSTGYSVTETAEGGVTKTINYFLNQNLKTYSLLDNTSNAIEKSNILKNVDYKKLIEPISANYHLVTYKKLIDTGVVQQQFVDEKGNEIAPTITSEKSDKGSTVTVATPPNEITYKGQTYLLQKENIPSSLVIKKGINPVTFRYKLQVVSEKGTPETHEVPAFNGGVSPSDAPVVDIPEYRGPLSMVGNPEVLEVPAFNGGVSPSDAPVVDIPEYRAPLSMLGNTEKLDFPKYKSPINGLDESAGQKRQIYTVKEKDLKAKPLEQKQVENQSKVSVKEISKEVELKQNGNTLPNTGTEKNELYQLVGITILSLLGLVTIKSSFKEK